MGMGIEMGIISEDFKYYMQDMSKIYLGGSLSYDEIFENDDVPFKFKAIISHYLYKEVNGSMTLAEHILSMDSKSFSYMTYHQLKVKVKLTFIDHISEKSGKITNYNKIVKIEELTADPNINWSFDNIFVEEIIISKIGLMSFSV